MSQQAACHTLADAAATPAQLDRIAEMAFVASSSSEKGGGERAPPRTPCQPCVVWHETARTKVLEHSVARDSRMGMRACERLH